ncbi:hypothetical protein PIB30_065336 [Stylosanthes scabra]|uniref:Uncharacterized protein n=1 Tax=Stylosanthes scabra TaxID=79078 RepID=A0ABU6RM35_9FABA|nr:hypothetical protein [Stylosanthes scabra]
MKTRAFLESGLQAFLRDLLVPRALFSHFRSDCSLLNPETLEQTNQGIERNGKQEPEEAKQQEEEKLLAVTEYAIQDFGASGISAFPAADGEWGSVTADQPWPAVVPQ